MLYDGTRLPFVKTSRPKGDLSRAKKWVFKEKWWGIFTYIHSHLGIGLSSEPKNQACPGCWMFYIWPLYVRHKVIPFLFFTWPHVLEYYTDHGLGTVGSAQNQCWYGHTFRWYQKGHDMWYLEKCFYHKQWYVIYIYIYKTSMVVTWVTNIIRVCMDYNSYCKIGPIQKKMDLNY